MKEQQYHFFYTYDFENVTICEILLCHGNRITDLKWKNAQNINYSIRFYKFDK